jgi:sugar-specific transcriptional regulator TrmB/DNA-binding CsgD family transcriptional regulator
MWDAVGVSGTEATAYEALVHRGQADAETLAGAVGVSKGQVTRVLRRLVQRGLATRLPGAPARYVAVPPDLAAGSLIADRERELSRLRTHADQLAAEHARQRPQEHDPASLVEIIDGASNVQSAFVRLQRTARHEIRTFDRPPYLEDPIAGNEEQYIQSERRKLVYRVVYHSSALEIPGRLEDVRRRVQHGERARVSRHVPMKMALCDDQLALIPVTTGSSAAEAAYLVHPSSMLDAFSELFEALWHRAVRLNDRDRDRAVESDRPIDDRLLGLLSGGATDETIARALGWSPRTVHRHVHRMMAEVGAETRFQAGMEVVRRGWA